MKDYATNMITNLIVLSIFVATGGTLLGICFFFIALGIIPFLSATVAFLVAPPVFDFYTNLIADCFTNAEET